jgi:hypothetical protein
MKPLRKDYMMDFNIDSDLTALALVHSIISDGNEIANKIEALMTETPAEAYGFPKENVYKIIAALRMNASLSKNLLEQHQKNQEMIQEIVKKFNPETPQE